MPSKLPPIPLLGSLATSTSALRTGALHHRRPLGGRECPQPTRCLYLQVIRPSQVFSDVIIIRSVMSFLVGGRPRIVSALVNLHCTCPLLVHFRISYYLDRIPPYTTIRQYDVMVGCSFTSQGKKGIASAKR